MAGYRTEWLSPLCNCEWRHWCQKYDEECLPCKIEWFKAEIEFIEAQVDVRHAEAQLMIILEAEVASLRKEENAAKNAFYKAKRKRKAAASELLSMKKRRV